MKNQIRKEYLKKRSSMTQEEQIEKSKIVFEKIIKLEEYEKADWVFTYLDMGSELKTKDLIEKAWEDGKKVALPIAKKNRVMYFVQVTNFENMKKTSLGVTEPDVAIEDQVYPTKDTLFIVPGSVFDESKNRCGYGGGYYDTYTEEKNVEKTVGICFDFQVIEEIPVESFDRKLTKIITEKRIIE